MLRQQVFSFEVVKVKWWQRFTGARSIRSNSEESVLFHKVLVTHSVIYSLIKGVKKRQGSQVE